MIQQNEDHDCLGVTETTESGTVAKTGPLYICPSALCKSEPVCHILSPPVRKHLPVQFFCFLFALLHPLYTQKTNVNEIMVLPCFNTGMASFDHRNQHQPAFSGLRSLELFAPCLSLIASPSTFLFFNMDIHTGFLYLNRKSLFPGSPSALDVSHTGEYSSPK